MTGVVSALVEPYPRELEDDTTLFSLLVVEEAVVSEDELEVDEVSTGVEVELSRLVGMGKRVLKSVVSLDDEVLLEISVELLVYGTAIEPVPGILPDEVDVPAYIVVELPNNGDSDWVVESPGGNAVPLLDGTGEDGEERSLEVYTVDVALGVALELV